MIVGLTARQADLVRTWGEFVDATGRAPSLREAAAELDLANQSCVHRMVIALVERGWLAGDRRTLLRRLPPLEEPEIEITERGVVMSQLLMSASAKIRAALEEIEG